jgi:hypothetical protein
MSRTNFDHYDKDYSVNNNSNDQSYATNGAATTPGLNDISNYSSASNNNNNKNDYQGNSIMGKLESDSPAPRTGHVLGNLDSHSPRQQQQQQQQQPASSGVDASASPRSGYKRGKHTIRKVSASNLTPAPRTPSLNNTVPAPMPSSAADYEYNNKFEPGIRRTRPSDLAQFL